MLPLSIAGRKPDPAWFDTVVDTVGLRDRLKHRPNELSGGQQQRVACARALVSQPEIVFADEPTGNLDSTSGAEVLGFLRRSVDEHHQTIVMVTHDPVAAAYTDRVVFLDDGQVVDELRKPTADAVLEKMKVLSARDGRRHRRGGLSRMWKVTLAQPGGAQGAARTERVRDRAGRRVRRRLLHLHRLARRRLRRHRQRHHVRRRDAARRRWRSRRVRHRRAHHPGASVVAELSQLPRPRRRTAPTRCRASTSSARTASSSAATARPAWRSTTPTCPRSPATASSP